MRQFVKAWQRRNLWWKSGIVLISLFAGCALSAIGFGIAALFQDPELDLVSQGALTALSVGGGVFVVGVMLAFCRDFFE